MRGYKLLVPADCAASDTEEDNRFAFHHMEKVCKADIRPSCDIVFGGGQGQMSFSSRASR
jgi:hypothetical protein